MVAEEVKKTLAAVLFMLFGFLSTMVSLAITHERRQSEAAPLPDLVLDNLPYAEWPWRVSGYLVCANIVLSAGFIICHKFRFVIIRRVTFIIGLLYLYRALFMLVTVLPDAKDNNCLPQLGMSASLIMERVWQTFKGLGLSLGGNKNLCGDYIFSGHTVMLVLAPLLYAEYAPPRFDPITKITSVVALAGVGLICWSRGHYAIDIILAYVMTKLHWVIVHGRQEQSFWWAKWAVWFEEGVPHPLPPILENPFSPHAD